MVNERHDKMGSFVNANTQSNKLKENLENLEKINELSYEEI